jgi:nitrite reductase/ring-hydroxylating ferredoxin subunit
MSEESLQVRHASRRGVLLGAGLVGIGGAIVGCSTTPIPFDANMQGGIPHDEEVPTPTQEANGETARITVASTAEVPVGGGTFFSADTLIVTQPVAGEFKAFSAVCPHVGCLCDNVANGTIDCPCHGSTFRISDGSVVTGPARQSLTPVPIKVTDGMITLA